MIQILIGMTVAIAGVAMLLERSWAGGIALLLFGAAIANGTRHDTWLSFHFGDADGGSGSDGGGDGGGD